MLRLAVIAAFTVSLFVGRVCPVPQKEEPNVNTMSSTMNAKNNLSDSLTTNNTTEVPRSPLKLTNNEGASLTAGGAESEKRNCTFPKELDDMRECSVSPHDDDDEVDDTTPRSNTTESTTAATTARTENQQNSTEANQVIFVPLSTDADENSKKATETTATKLNETVYETVTPAMNQPTKSDTPEVSGPDAKLGTKQSEVLISSVPTPAVSNVRTVASKSVSEGKTDDRSNDKSMPSGIIALVTAITFAITAVIAYISMIAWRRYLEYRYGHRELLVNELEFDTNDLRHFEL